MGKKNFQYRLSIVQDKKSAGEFSVEFHASSLSSRVYFCIMTADNSMATK
jgi:hypothetical protein